MSRTNKPATKDMYWFAHGGAETEVSAARNAEEEEIAIHNSNSPSWNVADRKGSPDDQRGLVVVDGYNSSGPSSLEREDRLRAYDKRHAVEERRKLLLEAEQERNDAVLRKHLERDAALEARRNAQRSNISFAFGSSVPRYQQSPHENEGADGDVMSRSFTASGLSPSEENHFVSHDRRSVSPLNCNGYSPMGDSSRPLSSNSQSYSFFERKVLPPPSWLSGSGALVGDDVMSRSMHAAIPAAPRGRRKNDLMPVVIYDRNPTPRTATSTTRKRSVSMTRLDQLAQPRKHYVEAQKANTSATNAMKDLKSPSRPLSSASEHSGGSGRTPGTVTRRIRSSPRKARPVSIAGTLPDHRLPHNGGPLAEGKVSPIKRSYTPNKKATETCEVRKSTPTTVRTSTPKVSEKHKPSPKPSKPATTPKPHPPPPSKSNAPKAPTPKAAKSVDLKASSPPKQTTPSSSTKPKEKKPQSGKKKVDPVVVATPVGVVEVKEKLEDVQKANDEAVSDGGDPTSESERNAKRIISEEEARTALAEKRRLAREQAEREAELEKQRLEQLRLEEEERLRQEEEDQRKFEEEQLRLLEEHRRVEEEKLRKAIEDNERKEEEEKAKHEEEMRLKVEQEKKAKEEAEKQRLELEEKLRKEEEERAERKKRLEKIMSRTRGKSSGTSPSGSVSGSDHLDSGDNQQEHFSSGANSLDSNEGAELPSEQGSLGETLAQAEGGSSIGDSMEANPTYDIGSENESLNSNDLMMPVSETASQESSFTGVLEKMECHPGTLASELSGLEVLKEESDTNLNALAIAVAGDSVSPTNDSALETVVGSVSPNVDSALETTACSVFPTIDSGLKTAADSVSPIIDSTLETTADSVSPIIDSTLETATDSVSPTIDSALKTTADSVSPTIISAVETAVSPSVNSDLNAVTDSFSPAGDSDLRPASYSISDSALKVAEDINEVSSGTSEPIHQDTEIASDATIVTQKHEILSQHIDNLENINYSPENQMMQSMYGDAQFFGSTGDHQDRADFDESDCQIASAGNDEFAVNDIPFSNGSPVSQESFKLPDVPSSMETLPPNFSFGVDGLDVKETDPRSSISSDIKLPDPLYETSDEGSISSEKQQAPYGLQEEFRLTEEHGACDDVFCEQPIPEAFPHHLDDAFIKAANPFSVEASNNITEESHPGDQPFHQFDMTQSIYLDFGNPEGVIEDDSVLIPKSSISSVVETDGKASSEKLDSQQGVLLPTASSTSSVIEADSQAKVAVEALFSQELDGNKENVAVAAPDLQGHFSAGNNTVDDVYDPFSNKENTVSNQEIIDAYGVTDREIYRFDDSDGIANNFFDQNSSNPNPFSAASSELRFEEQRLNEPSVECSRTTEGSDDVTFIQSEESGACIGIISSIDHDQISNDFPKPSIQNEQLKNFEFASMTDSEDNSSLDSNLSQVMTAQNGENNDTHSGLNNHAAVDSQAYSNGEQQHNPFGIEQNNHDGYTVSNTNNFNLAAVSNGHRLESSNSALEPTFDGSDILSVDHPQNNVFENVEAIPYEKMSSDPFAPKGSSKQISGNPFLLQDDSKQVLMTTDFLN